MTENTEHGAGTFGLAGVRDVRAAVASGRQLVRFFDDVPEEKADAVARMVQAAATIAATAPSTGSEPDEWDPLMLAFAELGAMPWSQRPVRGGRPRPMRQHRPLTVDRRDVERASTATPRYPHVVLDGDTLDGNAIALVAAVTSAMRAAGIPDEEIDSVPDEALSKDYRHVLTTVTGLVTITWQGKRRRASASQGSTAAPYRREQTLVSLGLPTYVDTRREGRLEPTVGTASTAPATLGLTAYFP